MIFMQFIGNVIIKDALDNNIILKYHILKKFYKHKRQKICYGICVEKYTGDLVEKETIENLTFDSEAAYEIANKLLVSTVTPMTLAEVLDDMELEVYEVHT